MEGRRGKILKEGRRGKNLKEGRRGMVEKSSSGGETFTSMAHKQCRKSSPS